MKITFSLFLTLIQRVKIIDVGGAKKQFMIIH